jgi:hypothetical protein
MNGSIMEARAWIKSTGRFAPERFESREEALDFVYKLYRSGAVVVAVNDATSLVVELPTEREDRDRLLSVCRTELEQGPCGTLRETGRNTIELVFAGSA